MKSIINKQNVNNLPLSYILIFLTVYLCPNFKLLSVGENSALPAFLLLLSFSFLSIKEIVICITMVILTFLSLLLSSNDYYANYATVQSGLISYYIIVVPITLSLIIGRIFSFRFRNYSNKEKIKEIKYIIYYFIFIFFISGILNYFSPSFLSLFLFTGRTSFNRFTFWFTEPSQAASVILFIWFFALQFLCNKKFITFFGKDYYIFLFILLSLASITSILSLPGTLILQLVFSLSLILFIFVILNTLSFLVRQNLNLKFLSSLFRPTKLTIIYYLLFLVSAFIIYKLLQSDESKLAIIVSQIGSYGYLEGLKIAGGFRSYYSAVSVYFAFNNPISLPGDWLGTFISDLLTYLQLSSFSPGDDIFQLTKSPINIKPLGWLYFCLYDLGFIGFGIYFYLFVGKYIRNIFLGILKVDIFYITLFVFQIAILIIPVLPSTPSVFIPLIFAVFIKDSSIIKNKF
tara:strand:+ start:12485 stop:13864 length:1380 start_codon:yes stop_codon:yes gene_type:complete